MDAEKFLIEKKVVDALLAYLQTRPYAEVCNGVQWLTNLEPLKPENKPAELVPKDKVFKKD